MPNKTHKSNVVELHEKDGFQDYRYLATYLVQTDSSTALLKAAAHSALHLVQQPGPPPSSHCWGSPRGKQQWWGLKGLGYQRSWPDWARRWPFLKGPSGQHLTLASTVYPFWPFYINRLHIEINHLRGKGNERNWNSSKHASYKQTLIRKDYYLLEKSL